MRVLYLPQRLSLSRGSLCCLTVSASPSPNFRSGPGSPTSVCKNFSFCAMTTTERVLVHRDYSFSSRDADRLWAQSASPKLQPKDPGDGVSPCAAACPRIHVCSAARFMAQSAAHQLPCPRLELAPLDDAMPRRAVRGRSDGNGQPRRQHSDLRRQPCTAAERHCRSAEAVGRARQHVEHAVLSGTGTLSTHTGTARNSCGTSKPSAVSGSGSPST